MTRGNRARALATLERIAKDNGKPMPLGKLVEATTTVSLFGFNLFLTFHVLIQTVYLICFPKNKGNSDVIVINCVKKIQ